MKSQYICIIMEVPSIYYLYHKIAHIQHFTIVIFDMLIIEQMASADDDQGHYKYISASLKVLLSILNSEFSV